MRPPLTYFGGKTRLASWVVSLLPPHDAYVEPFCGSAAVLFAKDPAPVEIVNDIDGELVHFFRVLRSHPDELVEACRWTPYAREEFDHALEHTDKPIERARRFWIRSHQAFGGRVSDSNGWSISVVEHTWRPRTLRWRVDELRAQAERLTLVGIENCDAVDLIDRLSHRPNTVIYVDPPYLFAARSHRAQHKRGGYLHEYGTEDEHRRLADALHRTPATVLLSGYHSPLYDELYREWPRVERRHTNQIAGRRATPRQRTVEVIWSNRELRQQPRLIDVSALGCAPADVEDQRAPGQRHERDERTREKPDWRRSTSRQLDPPPFDRAAMLARDTDSVRHVLRTWAFAELDADWLAEWGVETIDLAAGAPL